MVFENSAILPFIRLFALKTIINRNKVDFNVVKKTDNNSHITKNFKLYKKQLS